MAPRNTNEEIIHDFLFFRVYKDGRLQMKLINEKIPPYDDPFTGVRNKDLIISYKPKISARIFMPSTKTGPSKRLPLIFYIHGNGFCLQIAFAQRYQTFLTPLAAEANAIVVTFTYGVFPDQPLSACYEDSWQALHWVLAHSSGDGPEPWLNSLADYRRFFILGNSSGAAIAHFLAARIGWEGGLPSNVRWIGLGLIQPVFAGCSKSHDDQWEYMSNGCKAPEDPRQKPAIEDMKMIRCERILVSVAGDDVFKKGGIKYFETLRNLGWGERTVDLEITPGQSHSFHVYQPNHEHTLEFIEKLASFINKEEGNPTVKISSNL